MFQQNGEINDNLQPIVSVKLTNGATVNCLLDTGFDGTIILPRDFVENNSMLMLGSDILIAAEQQEFEIETAIAEINWLGDEFQVRIYVSEHNEAIIGVEMLVECVVTIDFINSKVAIDKPA